MILLLLLLLLWLWLWLWLWLLFLSLWSSLLFISLIVTAQSYFPFLHFPWLPFPEYLLCFSRESDRQAGWGDPFLSICSVSAGSQPVRQDEGTLSWVSALFQQGVSPSGRMRGPFPEYLLCFSRESARQAGWGDPFLSICSVSAGSQPVRQDEGILSWVSALFQQGVSPSGRMRGCVYCSMTLEFYALWSASRSLLIAPRKCERAAFIRYKNAFRLELYSRPVYGRSWLTEKHCVHTQLVN